MSARRVALCCGVALGHAALAHAALGQTPADRTPGRAEQLSMQFAVPASPAFALVDVGTSSILRPQSFQQLSASLGSFASGGALQIPKHVGLEIAPFFLARARDIDLAEYRRHAARYRFRTSAAMNRDRADGGSELALGIRFTPIDASDPRTSDVVIRRVTQIDSQINALCVQSLRGNGPPRDDQPVGPIANCGGPAAKALMDKLAKAWVDSSWNRRVVDMALGAAARTRDSLGRDPRFRAAAAWISTAWPVRSWGQLVGGLNATVGRDSLVDAVRTTAAAGLGFYVGGNRYKGFAELRGSLRQSSTGINTLLGSEVFLHDGVWAHVAAGWRHDPGEPKTTLVSRFTLRTKFPLGTPN